MCAALERLGEGKQAPGYLLLQLLSQQGWAVDVVSDGERGVIVRASKLGRAAVERRGACVADVAVDVVKAAAGG